MRFSQVESGQDSRNLWCRLSRVHELRSLARDKVALCDRGNAVFVCTARVTHDTQCR
jgi:hypothetical protein